MPLNRNESIKAKARLRVVIAADEEFRTAHPEWKALTTSILEEADEPFKDVFDLDLDAELFVEWRSDGSKSGEILDDLKNDFGHLTYDLIIGFTKDKDFTHGGIAYRYNSAPNGPGISVVRDKSSVSNAARTVQHEISHNFGLGHDSGNTKCVMNTNRDDTVWHKSHKKEFAGNIKWYTQKD